MKTYKYSLIVLLLLFISLTSCEEQEVSPVISTEDYPMVSIETEVVDNSIMEGETAVYKIKFDKPIERPVTFTPIIVGGTADEGDYEPFEPVTLQAYDTEVEFSIVTIGDYFIELEETLEIQFEILGIAEKYLINPESTIDPINLTISEVADPTLLTINFAWDNDIDMDMVIFSDTSTYPETLWSTQGATGANPEADHSIWLADPVGDYYVCILDWWEGVDFNYTFTLAYPDNTVETLTGTFNGTDYPYETFEGPASWGSPTAYKVLKVVNDGSKFVVTKL